MRNYFPSNISYLMKVNNLNQEAFGNIIGKKRSVVGSYVRGESQPNIDILISLADYFGISLTDLVESDLSKTGLISDEHDQTKNEKKVTDKSSSSCEEKDQVILSQQKTIAVLDKLVAQMEARLSAYEKGGK